MPRHGRAVAALALSAGAVFERRQRRSNLARHSVGRDLAAGDDCSSFDDGGSNFIEHPAATSHRTPR